MSSSTAGVSADRIYNDKLSGASTREQRPGLAALLDHARQATRLLCVGIDSLGRNAAEVMTTIRDLRDRDIVLRSLREGIDTSNATARLQPVTTITDALGVSRATAYRVLSAEMGS
jgi:DNA invertase Pin-like site-specific DNA recombinase